MTASVAIIDYGSGNLRSAAKAFERSVRALRADIDVAVTADPDVVRRADRIVLPGVGAFEDCMNGLLAVRGMRQALDERVIQGGVPFLGICVGMQLMATEGHEKGVYAGLNWIMGPVVRLEPRGGLKVPHMGRHTLRIPQPHPRLANIPDGEAGLHAYFVHSYHLAPTDDRQLFAVAEYGQQVTACVGRDNMFGTQFHPEKSQTLGLTLIENFLERKP